MTDDPIRVVRPGQAGPARDLFNAFWPVLALTLFDPVRNRRKRAGGGGCAPGVRRPAARPARAVAGVVLLVSIVGTL